MNKNNENITNIDDRFFDDILSSSFSKYAKYIIQDRALPDIRDGLKPVQRRILYAMNELGLLHNGSFKKSARTVGEVIGKYHPHGDSSIYEAMVRMSQTWKNNVPLLEMHGNNGSIDGDPPAAMRYTEARLSQFGEEMLTAIKKNCVNFIENFDDSEREPVVLPSLLPNILINGATGIAAGYATNIPPYNISEVLNAMCYRINHPDCSIDDILKIMPGPDFPTGAIIQGKDNIKEIYQTGRGKIHIKSKMEEVELDSKTIQFRITEIPYDVNKANLVKTIDDIRFNNKLPGIKEVRDESNKDGILICIEIEKDRNIDAIRSYLFKNTQLQIVYNVNTIVIKDRKPVLMNINNILDSVIDWSNTILIRSSQYDLDKLLNRKEIIEGLLKALEKIDMLINLIRSASNKEDAINKIISSFHVNNKQADAIVSLRLYNLTNIDIDKLKKEHQEIVLKIIELELIINNKTHRNNILIKRIEDKKAIYQSKRKSIIESEIESYEFSHLDVVDVVSRSIIITRKGYIKFINDYIGSANDLLNAKYQQGDFPIAFSSIINTLQHLFIITSLGRIISIPAYKIKTSFLKNQLGVHLNDFCTLDIDESIIFVFISDTKNILGKEILLATKRSLIKKISTDDFIISKNIKIQRCFKLKGDDKVIYCDFINEIDNEIISITNQGYFIRYQINEIPLQGRASSGIKNIKLKEDDYVVSLVTTNAYDLYLYLFTNMGYRKFFQSEIIISNRYNVGKKIFDNNIERVISINKFNNDIINLVSDEKYIQLNEGLISKMPLVVSIKTNENISDVAFLTDLYKKWRRQ
ncbi:MAG: DNA topoisomerase IV subunit A [Mycoplasmoidaceae bacterium]